MYRKGTLRTGISRDFPTINSFQEAEELYNSIRPIQGRRKILDLRPISTSPYARNYAHDRIVKVNDDEYCVTSEWQGASRYQIKDDFVYVPTRQGVIYHRSGLITVEYKAHYMPPNMVDQVLPDGLCMIRYDTKLYICTEDKAYLLPNRTYDRKTYTHGEEPAPLEFKKIKGEWRCLNPVKEKRQILDRQKTKPILAELAEKKEAVRVLWNLVEDPPKTTLWRYNRLIKDKLQTDLGNKELTVVLKELANHLKEYGKIWNRAPGGSGHYTYPEVGLDRLIKPWRLEVYKARKPVRMIPVPIGEVCRRPRI